MMSSNLQKATTGVAWVGFISIANILINIVTVMILSRLFSPEQFGILSSVTIITSLASIFWMMGIGPAIVQKKDLTEEDIITGHTLNIVFGVLVYLVVFVFSGMLADFLNIADVTMIWALSLMFIIHSLSGVSEALLQREMLFKQISLINVTMTVLYGVITVFLAYMGLGVWALILGNILSVFIKSTLVLIIKSISFKFKINKESAKRLMYFGGGHTLSRLFNSLAGQGDYIVVTRTLGTEILGLYNRAYSLLNIPANLIGHVFDSVLFPLLSTYQDDKFRLRYVYGNISVAILLLSIPIIIISVLLSDKIIIFFLSEKWLMVHEPFAILMLSLFFRTAYKISDTLVRSMGAIYKRLIYQIIYAAIVIVGAYIGHFFGLSGVAWAVGLAILINYILMFALSVRLININIPTFLRMHAPVLVVGVITYMLTRLAYSHLPDTWFNIILIITTLVICLIIYIALFFIIAWKWFIPETREFFTKIYNTLFSKLLGKTTGFSTDP
jgi:PST family polysaccharide transporter